MKRCDLFNVALTLSGLLIPLVYTKVALGWFTASVIELQVGLLAVGFIFRIRAGKVKLALSRTDTLFLLLLCWAALTLPRAIDPAKTWQEFILLAESFLVFYMIGHGVREEEIPRLLRVWCFGAVIVSALGVMQFILLLKSGSSFYGYDHGFLTHHLRINCTFSTANALSGYLIMFVPILVNFAYRTKSHQRVYWVMTSLIVILALIFTYTRAGWLASAASLGVMAFLLRDKRLLIGLSLLTLLAGLAFPEVIHRAASLLQPGADLASLQRKQLWEAAILMWKDHSFSGVGIGNYSKLLMTYAHRYPQLKQIFEPLEPHSSYLKFLAETGIVGLGLFLAVIFRLIKQIFKVVTVTWNPQMKSTVTGVMCGGLAFLLQSNTNSLFHDLRVALVFWSMAGVMVAMPGEQSQSDEESQTYINGAVHSEAMQSAGVGIEA